MRIVLKLANGQPVVDEMIADGKLGLTGRTQIVRFDGKLFAYASGNSMMAVYEEAGAADLETLINS